MIVSTDLFILKCFGSFKDATFCIPDIVCTVVLNAITSSAKHKAIEETVWRRKVKELNGHLCFAGRAARYDIPACVHDYAGRHSEKRIIFQPI